MSRFSCNSLDSTNKILYNIPMIAPRSKALRNPVKAGCRTRVCTRAFQSSHIRFLSSRTACHHNSGIFPFTEKRKVKVT